MIDNMGLAGAQLAKAPEAGIHAGKVPELEVVVDAAADDARPRGVQRQRRDGLAPVHQLNLVGTGDLVHHALLLLLFFLPLLLLLISEVFFL
jgi:hypothetical protein